MKFIQFFLLFITVLLGQPILNAYSPVTRIGARLFSSIKGPHISTDTRMSGTTPEMAVKNGVQDDTCSLFEYIGIKVQTTYKFTKRGFIAICATLTMF